MSKGGKFGADKYRPHNLGPEPAGPVESAAPPVAASIEPPVLAAQPAQPPVVPRAPEQPAPPVAAPAAKLRDIKVQFSSRITYAADQQLKALAKDGPRQTELLAEALNLLFKKHGLEEIA